MNFTDLIRMPTGYHARKAAGLCVEPHCREPLVDGCVRCRLHLDMINVASKTSRARGAAARAKVAAPAPPPPRRAAAPTAETRAQRSEERDASRGERLGAVLIRRDADGRLIMTRVGRSTTETTDAGAAAQ